MWVNNLPEVATQWNSGTTRAPTRVPELELQMRHWAKQKQGFDLSVLESVFIAVILSKTRYGLPVYYGCVTEGLGQDISTCCNWCCVEQTAKVSRTVRVNCPCMTARVEDIAKIESEQQRFTNRFSGVSNVSYSDRLRMLGSRSLRERRLHQDLIYTYKVLFSFCWPGLLYRFFSVSRGHVIK